MDQNLLPRITVALNTLNIHPHKLRGQNFLVSEQIVNDICSLDTLMPEAPILEIGAGLGSLSMSLANKAARLDLLEIELPFAKRLEDIFAARDNTHVHHADALQFDYQALYGDQAYQIYGNIPYNITTPLIKKLLIDSGSWQRMVLMVQAEAGQRLVEGKGRANGPLTLMLDSFANSRIQFFVPKEAFYPIPAVRSAVISIDRKADVVPDTYFQQLFALIEGAFALRRKTMANSLGASALVGNNAYWQEILSQCGLKAQSRAEELCLDDFRKVFAAYQNR